MCLVTFRLAQIEYEPQPWNSNAHVAYIQFMPCYVTSLPDDAAGLVWIANKSSKGQC
jgi:hypothetical protein